MTLIIDTNLIIMPILLTILTTQIFNKFLLIYTFTRSNNYFTIYQIILVGLVLKLFTEKNHLSINPALQNTLAIIHPYIILYYYNRIFSVNYFPNTLKNLSAFGLFLGGVWSYQELNWGGWWNWDFVETPLLFLILQSILGSFHVSRTCEFEDSMDEDDNQASLISSLVFVTSSSQKSIHTFIDSDALYQNSYFPIFVFQEAFVPIVFNIIFFQKLELGKVTFFLLCFVFSCRFTKR